MITEDGYALVMCHEIGHHLRGIPKKTFEGCPSVEGQADYFATLKCLRKVFRRDEKEVTGLEIPGLITEKCQKSFREKWEVDICIRNSMAGLSVSAASSDIRNTSLPTVETPDLAAVQKTYEAHPLPQCRLDTYFQGSICEVSSARTLTTQDETTGARHPSLGHKDGIRPFCWYKSSK